MKNKYNDNKLAEEFDLIVLTGNEHEKNGLSRGDLGTLTYSYTGKDRPLYAEFACADGSKREEALSLHDFRVLNEQDPFDRSVIVAYLQTQKTRKKTQEERFASSRA